MSTITTERWLTLKEAAERLDEDYGLRTTWRYLEKLVREPDFPSALNFGKRQVKISELYDWLLRKGIVER